MDPARVRTALRTATVGACAAQLRAGALGRDDRDREPLPWEALDRQPPDVATATQKLSFPVHEHSDLTTRAPRAWWSLKVNFRLSLQRRAPGKGAALSASDGPPTSCPITASPRGSVTPKSVHFSSFGQLSTNAARGDPSGPTRTV